jgi:uncharacterized repeat protein (TIGR01451 family)
LAVLALALLAIALAAVPALGATPAQIELVDRDPIYSEVQITLPDGTTADTSPGWFQLDVTANGATTRQQGFCVDTTRLIGDGITYDVVLQNSADDPSLASPAYGQIAWLMQEAPGLIGAAADPSLEAGALQIAVWILGGQVNAATPTDDPVLNARAFALVALSAGKRVAGPVGISAASTSTCAGGSTTLTVTGTPGATASLAVVAGQGTLSQSTVTFGPSGTATVGLASGVAGAVQVRVTQQGAEFTIANRPPGTDAPQTTGFLFPRTYTAAVTVNFTPCPPPATVTQVTPPPVVQPRPVLRVTKRAPKAKRAGSRILYRVTVRNTSRTTARNVVVRDRLPRSLAFSRSSMRAASVGKTMAWKLGTLRPGQSRTLRIWLIAPATLNGKRTNVVTVSANRARTVRASAPTQFRPLAQRILPAVTG